LCAFPLVLSVVLVANTSPSAAAKRPQQDLSKIQHIVLLMQENRSYDSYFGLLHQEGQHASAREPMTGNPNPIARGRIRPFLQTNTCDIEDVDHSWTATHNEIDGGRMDGFTKENAIPADPTGSRSMARYDVNTLPFYYTLATQFSVADHYFASVPGPTYPNRFYYLTGTSFGHITNDLPPAGGFTQKTIFQSLDEAHVTYKIYLSVVQVEQFFSYVQQHPEHIAPISQYYTDLANNQLPQVSYLESNPFGDVNTESDEHPPANVQVGEKFTHDAIKALADSPEWSSSAFILTYDEHGGYYDHIAPPKAVAPDNIPPMLKSGDTPAGFDQYGVRVPTMVISPWAKAHHVSHVTYDHTSILKFLETRFGMPPLTQRDAAADPMLDMFDTSGSPQITHPNLPDAPIDAAGAAHCAALHGGSTPGDL
jgi:phospholipase C